MTRLPVQPSNGRPVISVNLEELKFWLSIMQEHALFIKAGLPVNRKEAIQEAQEFYRCFGALLAKANTISSDKKFAELIRQSAEKVEDFYRFKRRLLQVAMRGELGGALYPSMLDHLSREAEYFLRLLESMNDCKAFRLWPKTKEASFWIRLMSDHSDFIRQMLDPSEAILIDTTEGFSGEFDELFRQSIDFTSMLRSANGGVPAFGRFLQDSRVAGMRLRDFKRALHTMLEEKKVLSLMTPLFADHIRREADHFLMVLAMLENDLQTSGDKGTNSVVMPLAEEDIEDAMLELEVQEPLTQASMVIPNATIQANNQAAEVKLAALKQKSTMVNSQTIAATNSQFQQELDSEVLEELDDEEPIGVLPAPALVTTNPIATNPASKLKYKWSSAWPRPLGED